METNSKTVEQVCEKIASVAKEMHESDYGEVWSMAYEIERCNDEILAAHKRELAAKDAEILSLKSKIDEYERQPELMADTATKALELHKRQDAEIASLRALVKDLAVALNASCDCHSRCDGCDMADESKFDCPDKAFRALVAKAREVCK